LGLSHALCNSAKIVGLGCESFSLLRGYRIRSSGGQKTSFSIYAITGDVSGGSSSSFLFPLVIRGIAFRTSEHPTKRLEGVVGTRATNVTWASEKLPSHKDSKAITAAVADHEHYGVPAQAAVPRLPHRCGRPKSSAHSQMAPVYVVESGNRGWNSLLIPSRLG